MAEHAEYREHHCGSLGTNVAKTQAAGLNPRMGAWIRTSQNVYELSLVTGRGDHSIEVYIEYCPFCGTKLE